MKKTKWILDPYHSEVSFKVKHLMISTVTGSFKNFTIEAETEGNDFNTVKDVTFTADIHSIDTHNAQRDAHLKSADFFHAEENPRILFKGEKYEAKGEDGKLYGDLTIAGITRPVVLDVEFGGIAKDPYGQTKAGFTVSGSISRKEFGITYGAVTEAGGVVIGDEIKINAEVQLQAVVGEEVLAEA